MNCRIASLPRTRATLAAFILTAFLVSACSRDQISGPPEVRVGRDECAECGMLIADERFAAGVLLERNGLREYALFDDLGCMLDHERKAPEGDRVLERYVRDYDTRAWLPAVLAAYALVDEKSFPTPMGSGLVAVGNIARAKELAATHNGKVLDFGDLAQSRLLWLKDRYGEEK